MSKSFFTKVLPGYKNRQRFSYFINLISILCAIAAFIHFGGIFGLIAGAIALIIGFIIIGPIAAFIICFIEQMLS